jgi:thiamine biosynthesis lipoprotein
VASAVAPGPTLVRFDGRAMASPLRLSVAGESPAGAAGTAWAEVLDEFAASEQAMSRFRETSALTILNRAAGSGRAVRVDRRLERAVVIADRARRRTGGRFDPRVLMDLERLGDRGVPIPGATIPEERPGPQPIARHVGRGWLSIDRPLDLGGIGKGLALRWSATRIRAVGVERFLLDAGGDLVVAGPGPDGGPWLIGVEDPAGGADRVIIGIVNGGVATSSLRRRQWVHGGRHVHHLLDPRTGEPAGDGLAAVTVVAADPAWAEVRSKALFVGGRRAIAADARADGLAAWWIDTDGALEMTPAARQLTVWVDGEPA